MWFQGVICIGMSYASCNWETNGVDQFAFNQILSCSINEFNALELHAAGLIAFVALLHFDMLYVTLNILLGIPINGGEYVQDTIILNIFQVIASLCYALVPDQRQAIT